MLQIQVSVVRFQVEGPELTLHQKCLTLLCPCQLHDWREQSLLKCSDQVLIGFLGLGIACSWLRTPQYHFQAHFSKRTSYVAICFVTKILKALISHGVGRLLVELAKPRGSTWGTVHTLWAAAICFSDFFRRSSRAPGGCDHDLWLFWNEIGWLDRTWFHLWACVWNFDIFDAVANVMLDVIWTWVEYVHLLENTYCKVISSNLGVCL